MPAQNPAGTPELEAAEAALLSQVESKPSAAAWQKLGLIRHLRSKCGEAIPAFTAALELDASLWTSHLFLGICRYRTNQFAPAVQSLRQADRLGPPAGQGRDEIDFWTGAALIAAGEQFAGLRSLEKLLARQPRHIDALQLAAQAYAGASSALWNEIAERHFQTAVGQHIHAQVLESEGDTANALEAYRQARALDPARPGPAAGMGRLLLSVREPAQALSALEQELTVAPGNGEASLYAGLALIQLNRLAEAAAKLEVAMQALPRNPEPAIALAQVHLAGGQPGKAAAAAAKATTIAPRLAAAHELLVSSLGAAGDTAGVEAEKERWRRAIAAGAAR